MRRTVGSTLPIRQVLPIHAAVANRNGNMFFFQDGSNIKKEKNTDHHGPRTFPKISHLSDPPLFSLSTTFIKDDLPSEPRVQIIAVQVSLTRALVHVHRVNMTEQNKK
jgi:hypothetical protein